MKSILALALAGVLMTGTATMAEAKTKSFIVDGADFVAAGDQPSAFGVTLEDDTSNGFQFAFTLPSNYKRNSPVTIVFKTYAQSAPCTAVMNVTNVFRLRTGAQYHNATFGDSGMTGKSITYLADEKVINAAFTLRKAKTGPILDQKAGDKIIVGLSRAGNDPADICANTDNVVFTSAKIIYTVN